MILLPIIATLGLYVLIFTMSNENVKRIDSVIYSVVCNVVYCLATTELLSLFRALTRNAVLGVWLLETVVIAVVLCIGIRKQSIKAENIKAAFGIRRPGSIISFANIVILITVGILAFSTVPYNWDSMTYHLTRIAHWTLNKSVAHYACFDYSQTTDPNLAEFINLHVYLLSGNSDRLMNMLQYLSYVTSAILVGGICVKIGGDRRSRDISILCYLTTPIIFAEATTPQVDHVSAMFMLMFVWFAIDFIENEKLVLDRKTIVKLLVMGSAAGLTYDAKAHSCIAIVFFALWIVICCLKKKDKIADIVISIVYVFIPAVVIIIPEMIRNYITFGSIAADEVTSNFVVKSWDIRYYFVNFVDNVAFNMNNRLFDVTGFLYKVTHKLRLIFWGSVELPVINEFYFGVKPEDYNIDCAINPLVMWMFVLLVIALCANWFIGLFKKEYRIRFKNKDAYILVAVVAVIVFLSIARWYRYITRYEIGYLAIIIPAIMLFLQKVGEKSKEIGGERGNIVSEGVRGVCVFFCIVTAASLVRYFVPFAIPAEEEYGEYFRHRPALYEDYCWIADKINDVGYSDVGFICGNDSYEYPLYKMIEDDITTFQHVNVNNETAKYENKSYNPECIVVVDVTVDDEIECNGNVYNLKYDLQNAKLFCMQ